MLIFLLPFILLIALFFTFEPYDYFAIKGDSWYMSRSISGMRELMLKKPSQIILGDSRMANLNADYIEQLTGEHYTNLAFGGATLNESIEQFWFATQNTQLRRVVIGMDYYTLNNCLYSSERMQNVIDKVRNPFLFLADFSYWIDAMQNAKNKTYDLISQMTGNPEYKSVIDDPSSLEQLDPPVSTEHIKGYREDLYNYAKLLLSNMVGEGGYGIDYSLNKPNGYIQRILAIADYCKENAIELIIVLMPCNRAIWDLVIQPTGIIFAIPVYKDTLKAAAIVYDGEFYNDFAKDDTRFLDGHHLALEEKMRLARILFAGEQSPYWSLSTPDEYLQGKIMLTDQMTLTA